MSKVGKSVDKEMNTLKKIYLAIRLYESAGADCVNNCFIIKHCNC